MAWSLAGGLWQLGSGRIHSTNGGNGLGKCFVLIRERQLASDGTDGSLRESGAWVLTSGDGVRRTEHGARQGRKELGGRLVDRTEDLCEAHGINSPA